MINLKSIFLMSMIGMLITGCESGSGNTDVKEEATTQQAETVAQQAEPAQQKEINLPEISGNYVSADYQQRAEGYDWVAVSTKLVSETKMAISVRSRADKKKPTCTFDALATRMDDTTYMTIINEKKVLFSFKEDKITIKTDNPDNSSTLNFYCSGGASLAGEYKKINEPLDEKQIDKTLFSKFLSQQEIGFYISTNKVGSTEQLTILPSGLSIDNTAFTQTIEGNVTNAEIGDLNSDGYPEVLVYMQSGDNQRGNIIGVSVNNGKSMSPVYFPSASENPEAGKGYAGHDEFSIVKSTLNQQFPVFENGKKTAKIRQIDYKLVEGEAMRKFVVKDMKEIVKE